MVVQDFSPCRIQKKNHAFATSDRAVCESNFTAAGEFNVKDLLTSFNIPATDEESVASPNTNSAATQNTSFVDVRLVPLGKKLQELGGEVTNFNELWMAMRRNNEVLRKIVIRKMIAGIRHRMKVQECCQAKQMEVATHFLEF